MGARYIVSDTLARLANKHGVDVVYEAAKEWVAYVDRQKAIMVKHGMVDTNATEAWPCPQCYDRTTDGIDESKS